ncbi:hypothetical protein [Streptomyces sp. NPDC060333]|uniref:hypothetical protein n=1 Tax=Streptomyces sp. NPDC060333 TaxID=3347098 RepID=UPI00364F12A6
MPATLFVSRPAPLSAPLSRTEDAELIPSSCQACRASCGSDWVFADGAGFLVHRTGERCPVAVPFSQETGQPLTTAWTVAA